MTTEHMRRLKTILESIEDLPDFSEVDREKAVRNYLRAIKRIAAPWPKWFQENSMFSVDDIERAGNRVILWLYSEDTKPSEDPWVSRVQWSIEFNLANSSVGFDHYFYAASNEYSADDLKEMLRSEPDIYQMIGIQVVNLLHDLDMLPVTQTPQLMRDLNAYSEEHEVQLVWIAEVPAPIVNHMTNQLAPFMPILRDLLTADNKTIYEVLARISS